MWLYIFIFIVDIPPRLKSFSSSSSSSTNSFQRTFISLVSRNNLRIFHHQNHHRQNFILSILSIIIYFHLYPRLYLFPIIRPYIFIFITLWHPSSIKKFFSKNWNRGIAGAKPSARSSFFSRERTKGRGVGLALGRDLPSLSSSWKNISEKSVDREPPFRRPSRFCRKPETLREPNIRTLLCRSRREKKNELLVG